MKNDLRKNIMTLAAVTIAAFLMALNTKTFVNTGGLYPGGITGLTILLQRVFRMTFGLTVPFSVINIILNLGPAYIGFRYIGKRFTAYSCIMILLNSFFTDLIPDHVITQDVLLIAIFGGIINGFSISLCLNAGATSGGTDFISIFISERYNMDSFNIILGFNAVIIGIAGLLFGWDKALYSIIFQYASTSILHLLYKKFQQSTFFIVTNKPKEVCQEIYKVSKHGATILEGEGSYEQCERNVVYSVVSTAQTKKVIHAIKTADPTAFINEVKTQKLSGRFYLPKEK
ncbi:MAG: YitT family protein [Oscillospiraceae bacterium]|nr:YitT family protein [Oscillospiraceae bacterium]MDD6085438.1 YitT family protein [Oscillospiraceae bacterium]